MNGATVSSSGAIGAVTHHLADRRDNATFDANGSTDLLWRDSSGNTAHMVHERHASSSSSGRVSANIPTNWTVVAAGGFSTGDGDGRHPLARQYRQSGDVADERRGPSRRPRDSAMCPPTWSIVGTGDFDGDGNADLLWRDNQRQYGRSGFMSGATVSSTAGLGNIPTTWSVAGTGDFNGDKKSDILLARHQRQYRDVWLMNGGLVTLGSGPRSGLPTTGRSP